jgi:hypothetical protein
MTMPQAQGINEKIIFDTEDTFKTTPVAADAWILPFTSESLRLSRNLIDSKVLRANRNAKAPVRGNKEITGDINMELSPGLGKIFKHALGTVTTTGASEPYTHTFKIAALPSMCIEKQFLDLTIPKYFLYNGIKINSLKIATKPEGMIETTISVMGTGETVTNASFDASATDIDVTYNYSSFDGFQASILDNATPLGNVSSLDISLENNLDGSVYVINGTGERYSLPDGLTKVSGTLTTLFEDDTLYMKAMNSEETKLVLTFTVGSGSGTAGNEKLTITIPELILQPNAPVISGPTGVMVELPFTAYYSNSTETTSLQFELKNAMASME